MSQPFEKIPFQYSAIASAIYVLQHFSQNSLLEKIRVRNSQKLASALQKRKEAKGVQGLQVEIDRRDNLSQEDFFKNYLKRGVPVIFSKEAVDWDCTKKWNFDFLEQRYSDQTINVVEPAGLIDKSWNNSSEPIAVSTVTFKQFLSQVKEKDSSIYLRVCPLMDVDRNLIQDLNKTWLHKMRRAFFGVSYQNFIGPKNRRTRLHSELMSFFYIMVDGEKKWTLYPTGHFPVLNPVPNGAGYHHTELDLNQIDTDRFPAVPWADRYVGHLKKGDILYVPSWMWHEVENLTDSWGLSYQFTDLFSVISQPTFSFVRAFLTKPSFFKIFYQSFFGKETKREKDNFLTPKIWLKD